MNDLKKSDLKMSSLNVNNTASEHDFIPEINPHCILSQIYSLFIEFYYALFFKDMQFHVQIVVFRNSFFRHLNKALII
jgi:hypothetical protein